MHPSDKELARKYLGDCTGEILEIGSRNVNGTVRDVVKITVGIDMIDGKDVDVVMDACDLLEKYGEEYFDHSVTIGSLEHSPEWRCYLQNMISVTKRGGIIHVTAASPLKGRHDYPNDFWRFSEEMWRRIFKNQNILDYMFNRVSNGVVFVKESNELDMDFDPILVGSKQQTEFVNAN